MDWPTKELDRDLKRIGYTIVAGLLAVGAAIGTFIAWAFTRHRTVSRSDHR